MRIYNQFTEQVSVLELAQRVAAVATSLGLAPRVAHIANPRVEKEHHFYHAKHTRLLDLGLEPHLLTDETIAGLLRLAVRHRDRIDLSHILPTVTWALTRKNVVDDAVPAPIDGK